MIRKLIIIAVSAIIILIIIRNPARSEDLEFAWGQGLHQEEWFDPSDWFGTDEDAEEAIHWYKDIYGFSDPNAYYETALPPRHKDRDAEFSDRSEQGGRYDYYTEDWFENRGTFDKWHPEKEYTRVFKGKIENVRNVGLAGIAEKHVLISIRAENGDMKTVDLGPVKAFDRKTGIKKGGQITVGALRGID